MEKFIVRKKEKYYVHIPLTIILLIVLQSGSYVAHGYGTIFWRDLILNLVLLCISQSDLVYRKIPNLYCAVLICIALCELMVVGDIHLFIVRLFWMLGVGFVLCVMLICIKNSIGGGDIKMIVALTLLVGNRILYVVWIACIATLVVSICRSWKLIGTKGLKLRVPFGPYLSIGAYCVCCINNWNL